MEFETLHEQGSGAVNEDKILTTGNLFAVIDGATGLYGFKNDAGETGGMIAAQIVKEIFSHNNGSFRELFIEANAKLREEMLNHDWDITDKSKTWKVCFAAVRLFDEKIEWAQIADSLVLILFKDGSYTCVVDDYDHESVVLKKMQELAKQGVTDVGEAIKPSIISNWQEHVNVTYGVINGQPEAVKFMKEGTVPRENVEHILVFTDGLFIPKEHPDAPDDFDTIVRLFKEGGLRKIYEHVRALEERDPDLKKYPRFKKSDDASAIAITL